MRQSNRRLAPVLLACAAVLLAASCSMRRAVEREEGRLPRDPATGIILGAEPCAFDPPTTATRRGEAFLLVHGFLGTRTEFADLGARLAAAGYPTRTARLAGHGTSPRDLAAQTTETLYRSLLEQYRELRREHERVGVIGFSLGGSLATLLAANEDVDRLVLCAPFYGVRYKWYYGLPPRAWHGLLGWATDYLTRDERFVRVNRREGVDKVITYRVVPTSAIDVLFKLGDMARDPATTARVDCPVLMVLAEGDTVVAASRARGVFDGLGSREKSLVMLSKRSDHRIFWDYEADRACESILEFVGAPPK